MKTRVSMNNNFNSDSGFTLIEIMIALTVFSIVMIMVVKTFFSHQNILAGIDQRSDMQINARNAMHILETHLQMMGFSPGSRLDSEDAMDFSQGCRAEGGTLVFRRNDPDDISRIQEISINLRKADDKEGGGADGLADSDVGATGLILGNIRAADNIVGLRFAYAFDDDGDGCADLSAGNNIIWAIDTDEDGWLDTTLDTDDDGDVDNEDAIGGAALGREVAIRRIKAVKVWLLARTAFPLKGRRHKQVYVVGDQRCAVDDYYGHVLLETAVRCRNMLTD